MVSGMSYGGNSLSADRIYNQEMRRRSEEAKKAWPSIITRTGSLRVSPSELEQYLAAGMCTEMCGVYYEI